jgi:hypothetical protein
MKMKMVFFGIIAVLLVSCSSMAATSYFDKLYEVKSDTITDINGTHSVQRMVIDKNASMSSGGNESTTLITMDGGYALVVEADLISWRFIDDISVRTDNGVTKLDTATPRREVISGSRVTERVIGIIPLKTVEEMKKTKTFALQYKGRFVELPDEAIIAIKNFVNTY